MSVKRPAIGDPFDLGAKRVFLNVRRSGAGAARNADPKPLRRTPHPFHGIYAGSSWFLKVETDGSLLGRLPGNGAFLGRADDAGTFQLTVAKWSGDEQGRRQRLEYTDRVTGRFDRDRDGDLVLRLDIGGAYALYRVNGRRATEPENPPLEVPRVP